MAKSIGGKQAWMTRQGGILEETVHRLKELLTPTDAPTPQLKERRLVQIRQGIKELEMRRATFEKALDLFMEAVDEEYEHGGSSTSTRLDVETPKLAPLPLPKFRGHLWEWDQFWAIFSTTVHSKGISNIEKLTYSAQQRNQQHREADLPVESLQGAAKDAVKDLQITSDNYDLAINLLQRKYGNREAIVARLLQNLQQLHSQSDRISDQAQVLEKLLSIISQLEQKGEMVNTQHMQRTITGKFSDDIQRTMLRKKHASSSDAWTTRELLQQLEEYFHTEEEIQQIKGPKEETSKKPPPRRFSPKRTRDIPTETVRKYPCFYCGRSDHSPQICPKYSSYEQRMELIRQRNLCRNCGSRDHTVKDCPRGACRRCNEKGHHTSICRKSATLPNPTQPKPPEARHPARQEARPAKKTTTTQNLATIVANKQSVLRTSSSIPKLEGQVDLLVGQARIWNTRMQEFEDVQMILNTGTDQSFITTDYAQQLGLENTGHLQLQIRTFGNSKPVQKTCETTTIEIEDRKGERHHFNVAKIDFIAGQVERSPLDEADTKYLAEHDIRLSISPRSQTIEPRILLGCGDLFTLLGNGFTSHHDLPSGLKTDLNPADCATRGLTRDDLNEHLWWTGPDFLIKEQQAWPQCHELVAVKTHEDILPNLTPCVCVAAQVQHTDKEEPIDWTRHSSMSRAVSAFAYALRWLQRLTERVNPDLQSRLLERFPTLHTRYDDNFITVQERRDAMKILIRCHQSVHVANGINYSKDRLFPVTDHDGLIRCRGRLQQSDLSEAGKSPLLLGANTPLAALVIREAHMPHHLATAHTMTRVREEYWTPQLRRQTHQLPNRRVIHRPINLLVPLELDDTSHPEGQDIVDHTGEVPEQTVEVPEHTEELPQNDTPLLDVDTEPSNNVSERRYHLRNRPRPNYGQLNRGLIPTMLYLCCLANLCGTLSAQLVESPVRLDLAMASGSIQCTTEGILIETNQIDSYELCAEDFCVVRGNSPQKKMILPPPEITLHVHTVHLKVSYQGKMKILDTQCPAIPFCDRVECWFCTANLFYPECNPRAVIITIVIILYGIVAILYTFCYVPVVVGLPIRVVFIIATTTLQIAGKLAYSCYRSMRKTVRQRADGRRSTTGFVPLILVILAVHLAQACQNVDVFEMRATTCVKSSDENGTWKQPRTWNATCIPTVHVNLRRTKSTAFALTRTSPRYSNPVRRPWIEFEEYQVGTDQDTVKAIVRSLSTAEILVSIKEEFDSTVKEVTDSICTIEDTTITGCYHCPRGALAQVVCFAQERATMASVQCNDTAFAVPCSPEGSSSSLRFSMSTAQIKINCETSCGKTKKPFEITGVLHWTKTVQLTAEKILRREQRLQRMCVTRHDKTPSSRPRYCS
ncbi:hypothetical protein Aduo_006154 [Ancylostoma duodenale]